MKNKKFLFSVLLVISILLAACGSSAPSNPNIILATTTSTQDSGLLDVLIPMFEEQTGYVVQTIAVGTGQALKMGEEGNADVLLVHAPKAEEEFMNAGFGKERAPVMHNDFIIVGADSDLANIQGTISVTDALNAIYESESLFVSRGDDSGTHKKELDLWSKAALDPSGQSWYIESGQGMGATLMITSEKGAYTLTDRATFLAQIENLDLVLILEGDPPLLNPYHVITVNPEKYPSINVEGALAFYNFMISSDIQKVISEFGIDLYGQPLFFPDAE